jgi:hypothetical protein
MAYIKKTITLLNERSVLGFAWRMSCLERGAGVGLDGFDGLASGLAA